MFYKMFNLKFKGIFLQILNISYIVDCNQFNARDLQIECAIVLHESLLVPVLMYGSKTVLCKEEKSRIWAVQMGTLRGLLGIRRMDRVPNEQIRELCRVKKGLDERIDEGVLWWFSHVERMKSDRISKSVYV